MCKFGYERVCALQPSFFCKNAGRFTPLSHFYKKMKAVARTWMALASASLRLGFAPPRIPEKQRRERVVVVGSGVLRRLDILHRPVGLKVAFARGLRSPALRKQTACCSALVCPAMEPRRGRNATCFRAPALCVPGYGNLQPKGRRELLSASI